MFLFGREPEVLRTCCRSQAHKASKFCCSNFENREKFKVKTAHSRGSGSLAASLFNKVSDSKELGGLNFIPYFFLSQVKMFP